MSSIKPPYTIAVINSKGGVGKTTTSVAIAELLSRNVGGTCLLDLDRQGSAVSWSQEQPLKAEIRTVPADTPTARLARIIKEKTTGFDWLVIDTPPGELDRQDAAIEAVVSNGGVCIIPTGTSTLDLPRAAITFEEASQRVDSYVLMTKTRAGTNSVTEAREALIEFGAVVLAAEVPLREAINTSMNNKIEPVLDIYETAVEEILSKATR